MFKMNVHQDDGNRCLPPSCVLELCVTCQNTALGYRRCYMPKSAIFTAEYDPLISMCVFDILYAQLRSLHS